MSKRTIDQALDDGSRGNMGLVMENLHPGFDFNGALVKFSDAKNPEAADRVALNDNRNTIYETFMTWIVQNPIELNTKMFDAHMGANNPLYREIMPIVLSDEQVVDRKIFSMGRNFWELHTRKTLARYIGATIETIHGTPRFASQSVMFDKKRIEQGDGPAIVLRGLDAVFSNMYAYVHITVRQAFNSMASWYIRKPERQYPESAPPETVEEYLNLYQQRLGILSKEPQALSKVFTRVNGMMNKFGRKVRFALVTEDDAHYVNTKDETNTWREFSGASAVDNRTSETVVPIKVDGVEMITLPFVGTHLHDPVMEALTHSRVAHGSFWRFLPSYLDVDPPEYMTHMAIVESCSWETNQWDTYTIEKAMRNDVHFHPLNSDLLYGAASRKNADEGKLNRQFLVHIAKKVRKSNEFYYAPARTYFKDCQWDLSDYLKYVPEARGNQLDFAPIQCIGELDEHRTPASFLTYIYEVMEARLLGRTSRESTNMGFGVNNGFDGHGAKNSLSAGRGGRSSNIGEITNEEVAHFEEGLKLMEELGSVFEPEVESIMSYEFDPKKGKYFTPNVVGGPEFTIGKTRYYDASTAALVTGGKFDGVNRFSAQYLEGLGTVEGFLTVQLEVSRTKGRNGEWVYKKARGVQMSANAEAEAVNRGMSFAYPEVEFGEEIASRERVGSTDLNNLYSGKDPNQVNLNDVVRSAVTSNDPWITTFDVSKGTNATEKKAIRDAQAHLEARRAFILRTRRRLDTIFNFLAVLEKLTKKIMSIQGDNFSGICADLLPQHNRHDEMQPLHAAMIMLGKGLISPFKYPLVWNAGTMSKTTGDTSANTLPQPTQEEITKNKRAEDFLTHWNTDGTLKSYFSNFGELKRVVDNLKALEQLSIEVNEAYTTAGRGKQVPEDVMDQLIAKFTALMSGLPIMTSFAAIPTKQGQLIALRDGLKTVLDPKLKKEYLFIVDLFQDITGTVPTVTASKQSISTTTATATRSVAVPADLLKELKDSFRRASSGNLATRTPTQTDASNLDLFIRQLHYRDSAIRKQDAAEATRFWRAGIAVHGTGPEFAIDQERYKSQPANGAGALFDEHYANSFAGTIFNAGPFISSKIHPAPISGYFAAGGGASLNVVASGNRSQARYASGFPVTELMKGKMDAEQRVIKEYEDRVYTEQAFEYFNQQLNRIAKLKLPDLFIHNLAFPLSGHPDSSALSDFDRRWLETSTMRPILRLAARVVLLTDITIQNQQRWAQNNIPWPIFYVIARKDETQAFKDIICVSEQCGETMFEREGIQQIWSADTVQGTVKAECNIGHNPMIYNPFGFYIAERVRGGRLIGGCGTRFINEGVSRTDAAIWSKYVAPRISNGELQKNNSNIAIPSCYTSAANRNPLKAFDLRGEHKYQDYVSGMHPTSVSFASAHFTPMYDNEVGIMEAFNFDMRPPDYSGENKEADRSNNNLAHLKRFNHTVCQQTQRVWSKTEDDNRRYSDTLHAWGARVPGLRTREDGTGPVRISEHFSGSTLRYLTNDIRS